MKILITGGAGYIGGMLTDQFKEGPEVQIVAVDAKNQPKKLEHPRITWCISDLRKTDWHTIVSGFKPDVVIHCAWADARNEEITANVFEYCLRNRVPKFIHLSAIDGYGPSSSERMIENDPLRAFEDSYGNEVVKAEAVVKKLYGASAKHTQTYILRLPIIFGPYAWQKEHFFGTLKLFKSGGLPLFASNPEEIAFQAIHEDDLTDIIGLLAFNKLKDSYDVFNLTPEDAVPASGVAIIFGKKLIAVSPAIKKMLPVSNHPRLTYSVIADGSKFTKKFKYQYNYSSYETLTTEEGRYKI